jgi:twitching motility protein PilT
MNNTHVTLESLVALAADKGASDLHLEPGLPPALRIRGSLRTLGDPVPATSLLEIARNLIGETDWPYFLERRSFDLSRTIQNVRCRINAFHTARGIGFAIRILSSFQATIESLNLHPDLHKLVSHPHGLILVSGPTGSGKSSTLAALLQEINLAEPRHVLTIESPIEFSFRPHHAFIRQREVGRDTPSFEQALTDALREDPDVLMVGEMRDPETMRLTLNAAETGHLVMATVHSASCIEALQRIVAAFPAETQNAVAAQLADSLVAVLSQRLLFRPDLNIRVPECELLLPTNPVKAHIRNRDFFKIASVLETGAEHGMWTFPRYKLWLDKRTQWSIPSSPAAPLSDPDPTSPPPASSSLPREKRLPPHPASQERRIEIEPVEGGLKKLLRKFEES